MTATHPTRPAAARPLADGLTVAEDGPVLHARLDAPDGNVMSLQMCDALAALLRDPPRQAHVLVLAAGGPAFCLGRERRAATVQDLPGEVDRLLGLHEALRRTRLVTVARVHGDAAGYGVGLAALCDVAVAVRSARFSFPEVAADLAPALVLAWLPRVVGRRQAFWLTATGEPMAAEEARRLGLLNEVADGPDGLDAAVERRVADLRRHTPRVHTEIRDMLRAAEDLDQEQAEELARERLVLASLRRRTG